MRATSAVPTDFHRWIGADLELRIHAQPGAKKTEVHGLHGGLLKIRVRARAIEGAANAELLAYLAAVLQVAGRQCELVSGERHREKRILVHDAPRPRSDQILATWAQGRTSS